ncbi:MAG TPA: PKD domain-containing protein [Bacteroidales bacterium]|nr:PKD domain-containing protein [Bacteroidales bacterium]
MKTLPLILAMMAGVLSLGKASASITGDTTLCQGDVVQYSITIPAQSVYWTISGGNILGASNTDTLTVSWPNTGPVSVSVMVTGLNNVVNYYTLSLTVHPLPSPQVASLPYPSCPVQAHEPNPGSGHGQGEQEVCEKVCKGSTITYQTPLHPGSSYQWLVSGHASFTNPSPAQAVITWDATAYGSVTVIETNAFGCVDSSSICIEKVDLPVASFTHPSSACKLGTVYFTNTSSGATAYAWDFGDGGTSSLPNPSHAYANAGTYTITLIATNDCHCADTFQSVITIDSLTGPDISCPSPVCADATATYSTSVTGCTYQWVVLGGSIVGPSNQQSVTVLWGLGPLGMLGLVVSGCGGVCSDTTWMQVPILGPFLPINGPAKVCPGDCHTYTLPQIPGTTFSWSLNAGSCGYLPDSACCEEAEICWPPMVFPCTDTLTVTYYNQILGCGGTTSMLIRVRPELALYGPQQACANGSSGFAVSPSIPCTWSVSPAGPVISGSPGPFVNISWQGLTGSFRVRAVPMNPNQVCQDSVDMLVDVIPPPTAPVITGPGVVCAGATSQYCASGSGNVQWMITGGTPTTSLGNCITVSWGNTPPFIVSAFEQMSGSPYCSSDTTMFPVTLTGASGPPALNGSALACANDTSFFSTSTPYPPGATYTWSLIPFNAGSIISGQGTTSIAVEWGNNAPQTVSVKLKVSVCAGADSTTLAVTLGPAPQPAVSQIGMLCNGGSAQLNVTGGPYAAYSWSGPGGFSGSGNPVTITLEGLYQVTVTNAGGCKGSTQIKVQYSGNPVASISAQGPLQYCIGSVWSVSLCALGNPGYQYQWSNLSATQCINVSTAGSYAVTVTDLSTGCSAVSNVITVSEDSCTSGPGGGSCSPVGTVSFTHSSCNPKVFTNTSVNAGSFFWNFGDLSYSSLTNPVHTYNQAGFFLVTLSGLVPDAAGLDSCLLQDTALLEIPLLPRFSAVSGCPGDPVCFTDESVFTAGNNITSWSWNFGDSFTSSLQNPCHTYGAAGTYIVTLTIANSSCTTSWADTLVIDPGPSAAFSTGPGCVMMSLPFTDSSTGAVDYWSWDFGNGGSSLNQNPSSTYPGPGVYPVTLIVQDTFGCADTLTQNITITAPLVSGPVTALPDTIVCAGTQVSLFAPGFSGCTYLWGNGAVTDSILVSATGYYPVTITDPNGCPYSTGINILVNQPPLAIITGSGNGLCLGQQMSLGAPYNPAWDYLWISSDTLINGSTLSSVFFNPQNPGTYFFQLVITDTLSGCADTSLPYVVQVHTPPLAPLISPLTPTSVCSGGTILLNAFHPDPSVWLEWSNGDTLDTLVVTETGCYVLSATDTNGCNASANLCVTIYPLPPLCSFFEGCLDTCGPFLLQGPPGNSSYQWMLNGLPLPGDTLPNLLATVSGLYSLIVTNAYGCTDTTGVLDLSLHPCPPGPCQDFSVDSIYCDPSSGAYLIDFQVTNLSQDTLGEIVLQLSGPGGVILLNSPWLIPLLPGDTSPILTAAILNGGPGDSLCVNALLCPADSIPGDSLCCIGNAWCFVLPPCPLDTPCCHLDFLPPTVSCNPDPTNPGYTFILELMGCGTLDVQAQGNGTLNANAPLLMNGGFQALYGSWVPSNPSDTLLCLQLSVSDSSGPCFDTLVCVVLPYCGGDTGTSCCTLDLMVQAIECIPGPAGPFYEFSLQASGCGTLVIGAESPGNLIFGGPLNLSAAPLLFTGGWAPASPQDTILCLNLTLYDSTGPCLDSLFCFVLPWCNYPIPNTGACCLRNGSCIVTTLEGCRQQCGYWQGLGSQCGSRPCPRLDTLSGVVVYANTARSPLSGIWVALEDTARRHCREVVLTGPSGTFEFEVWPGDYELSASTTRPWPLGASNSLDALIIAKHFVRLDTLLGIAIPASNVDLQSGVNTTDAMMVMNRFVGNILAFPAGDWLFGQQLVHMDSAVPVGVELEGLVTGDANASYAPSKALVVGLAQPVIPTGNSTAIVLSPDRKVELAALSIELLYDEATADIRNVRMPGTHGQFLWNARDGVLRLAWYDLKERSWMPGEPLLELETGATGPWAGPWLRIGSLSDASDLSGRAAPFILKASGPEQAGGDALSLSAFPNPFGKSTRLKLHLPQEGLVSLEARDALGRRIFVKDEALMPAGMQEVELECTDCPSGIYHVRMEYRGSGGMEIRSLRLMKAN